MYLRSEPSTTVGEIRDRWLDESFHSQDINLRNLRLDLTESHSIDLDGIAEVPATMEGVLSIGDIVGVPSKFLESLDSDLQQHLLSNLLQRNGGVGRVIYTDRGLSEIRNPRAEVIRPKALIDVAVKVVGADAPVIDHWVTKDEFRLDVVVADGRGHSGGDTKVNDLTRGGIRIHHDRKHNLAPSVSEYLYRLVCTNGMEVRDDSMRIDARGQSVEEVLASLDEVADRAFRRVEQTIASFYDLRSVPVENPEREVIRIGEEMGLPSRTILTLAERVPAAIDAVNATMFDVVNLITNQANAPGVKEGPRRVLEGVGGQIITEHVDRCGHCRSRLN